MISNRGNIKELKIFDDFRYDHSLPKYIDSNNANNILNNSFITIQGNNNISVNWNDSPLATPSVISWSNDVDSSNSLYKTTLFYKLLNYLKTPKSKVKTISIFEFFKGIETNLSKIENISEISSYYENALVKAKKFGQKALQEQIENLINVVKDEIKLSGEFKFVTEKQIIDLFEKTDKAKNLKLTWIGNFGRIIPDNILEAKLVADEKMVFDNYVILHYDPENNGEALTKQEIERKKDPILFGVFKNSRKLYYIGDWKDEYCDLTLDEMFTILGDTVGEVNNDSVKTFIDNIKV